MNRATTQPSTTSQTIVVEHIRISTGRPFAEVRRKLESTVPRLDTTIAEALARGNQERAQDYEESGPKLSIFEVRDHGALLQIAGRGRNALQFEIGNPLTASKMTRYQLPAALYAPLRVVLFEDEQLGREPNMLGRVVGGAEDPLCDPSQRIHSLPSARTGAH
jgi:hypothetical protein